MNLVLLLVVVLEVCIGLCAWLSPQWLRAVAAHLLTRADVLDLAQNEKRRRMQYWTAELGLAQHSEEMNRASEVTPTLVNRQKVA
jgi:hypothetical protein